MHDELAQVLHQQTGSDGSQPVANVDHVWGMQVVTWATGPSFIFLLYDVLLTFDEEVQYIWPIAWKTTKFAYYFVRYFPVLFLLSIQFYGTPSYVYSNHACYIWNAYQAVATILIITGADYILLLRVFALYPANRTVRHLATVFYFAELVTSSIGMGLAIPYLRYDQHCGVTEAPATFLIAAGAPILFQIYLFAVTSYKFVKAVKSGWGDTPIMVIVMRDGTWAFTLLFLLLVAEAFLYGLAKDAYIGILYGWLNAAFSFCGYRILINLQKASCVTRSAQSAGEYMTSTDIDFRTEGEHSSEGTASNAHELSAIHLSPSRAPTAESA